MFYHLLRNATCALVLLFSLTGVTLAQSRNALIIGNGAYQNAPTLKTPVTDASIVAETLRAAGYDVIELHDVRQADTGQVMRDFLDKSAAGGPEGAAFFYYSGYGAQTEGENYLVPVDATINNDGDVADEAFRLNDLLDELAKTPLAARIVVLDASRDHKFGVAGGKPVAKGLAMGDTVPGALLAFAAAPGAISTDGDLAYSLYTGTLVTMMRQPGLDMEQIFKAARLQVNQATSGAQTPWMISDLAADVSLFAATAATAAAPESQNTTRAYWNYLKRYPNGAHAGEAQDQLAAMSAATAPPVTYVPVPEPLPPDYSDEAVGVVEIVPYGYDAPPSVFDVLTPLFIPRGDRGPRDFGDRRRDRFIPRNIPTVRGDPVRNFGQRDGRTRDGRTRDGRNRDATTTRDGKTGRTGN